MTTSRDSSQRRQTADDIKQLTWQEAVRLRPGLYVGGTDIHALHHLIHETVDHAIDEAMAGRCHLIEIAIHGDSSITISDNGLGLPVAVAAWGLSALEIEFTHMLVGYRPSDYLYNVSGGLHGVGLKAVNALSEWLIAEVRRDGYVWRQTYERGERTSDVVKTRPMKMNESTGTSITFRPDAKIFDGFRTRFDYNYDALSERI
jgi:DNA gyrase subunit B